MKFWLGCNYWDSASGTEMWKNYNKEVVEKDIESMAKLNIHNMRVFPNWRDFQPVKQLYWWRLVPRNALTVDDKSLPDPTGVDPQQIANFRHFAGVCERYGINLVVSVVTGWMSGRMFMPQAIDGKNPITDPEALKWEARFIRGFVSAVKDIPNIIMWDLGNECNCMGEVDTRSQAYVWTAFVRNAIRAEDPTRPISSGMHGLEDEDEHWMLADQGEIVDYVTTHPYVSPSLDNDYDPANRMRSTIYPTAQSMYYQDLSGKPVIMQEQNAFCDTTANPEMAADFARVNIFSCLAHGIRGHYWWCSQEHVHLDHAPYTWAMMERSLGIVDRNREPKPIGKEISHMSKLVDELPFDTLPDRVIDATCVITELNNNSWKNAAPAFVLAKQAGMEIKFVKGNEWNVYPPKAPLYLVPGVAGWNVMYKHVWDFLKDEIHNEGATMLMTYNGGSLIELEEVFGFRGNGCLQSNATHTAHFDFGDLTYNVTRELLIESVGAEVLAANETGNPVFTRYNYGKGTVYFLNMPLEYNLWNKMDAYNGTDWYRIYAEVGAKAIARKPIRSGNPQVGVTLHKQTDDRYIVCAVNYSDKTQDPSFQIDDGWKLTPICGQPDKITKCNGAFFYADKIH